MPESCVGGVGGEFAMPTSPSSSSTISGINSNSFACLILLTINEKFLAEVCFYMKVDVRFGYDVWC